MKELAKQYDPSQVEDRIYQFWLDGGYFHTKADPDKKPYTIVISIVIQCQNITSKDFLLFL